MERKRAIMAIVLCMLIVGAFVILNTYSLWQVTIKQNDENTIISSCIDIEYEDQSEGIENLVSYPISDVEGTETDGYRFKVINKCSEAVTYIIALESLEETGNVTYMPYNRIKIRLDNNKVSIYDDLDDLEKDGNGIRDVKKVLARTVAGNSYNEHEIKMWLDKNATLEDANKVFKSRIKITGGQGITGTDEQVVYTPESCFTVTDEGVLTGFKSGLSGCGKNIIIPPEVNDIVIKKIGTSSVIHIDKLDISNMYGLEIIDDCAFGFKPADPNAIPCNSLFTGEGLDLVMPENLKYIGNYAFLYYKGGALDLNDNLEYIGNRAFLLYKGKNHVLQIPDSVKTIGENAFQDYTGDSLILGYGLESIKGGAFMHYNGADITIFGSIKEIGVNAFERMGQDKTITIKKANSNGIILPENGNWHGHATVIYEEEETQTEP